MKQTRREVLLKVGAVAAAALVPWKGEAVTSLPVLVGQHEYLVRNAEELGTALRMEGPRVITFPHDAYIELPVSFTREVFIPSYTTLQGPVTLAFDDRNPLYIEHGATDIVFDHLTFKRTSR